MLKPISSIVMGFVVGLSLQLTAACAQNYPSKPIRFLQGFAPGGNLDVISRLLAEEMTRSLGRPVIAESRPGAGGNLATEQIVRAPPDGYSLVLLTTAHVISPSLLKSMSFDLVADLDFVSLVADFPFYVVLDAKAAYPTIRDVIGAAQTKSEGLTYGTAGTGTGQHMLGELLSITLKARLVHVPFRGSSGAVAALLAKDIDMVIAPLTDTRSNIEAGIFRPIAVSSAARWPAMKEVPTLAESVAPGLEVMAFVGVATTKGVPRPVLDRLNSEVRAAIASASVDKRLREFGAVPAPGSSEVMAARIDTEVKRWKEVAAKVGIKPN